MSEYSLATGVHVCFSADHVVFLDERCGKYLGAPLSKASGLHTLIDGWPVSQGSEAADPAFLQTLLRQGLITRDARLGKPATPITVVTSQAWTGDRWLDAPPAIRPTHVLQIVLAIIYATAAVRWLPLSRIVRRARQRKLQEGRAINSKQLAELMTIYERVRPWLYTRKDACMLHSLAVMEFLAWHGITPDWILGVRTSPFRAHSWLQYGGQAITDSPLKLARLTPLLMI